MTIVSAKTWRRSGASKSWRCRRGSKADLSRESEVSASTISAAELGNGTDIGATRDRKAVEVEEVGVCIVLEKMEILFESSSLRKSTFTGFFHKTLQNDTSTVIQDLLRPPKVAQKISRSLITKKKRRRRKKCKKYNSH